MYIIYAFKHIVFGIVVKKYFVTLQYYINTALIGITYQTFLQYEQQIAYIEQSIFGTSIPL